MPSVRQRPGKGATASSKKQQKPEEELSATSSSAESESESESASANEESANPRVLSILDVLRIIFLLFLSSSALSYYVTTNSFLWGYKPWFTKWPAVVSYFRGPITLTPSQLSLYNGTDPSLPIYLAINGTIFDVSASPHTYGPGGSYSHFAGCDATRAFVTGCFKDDKTPDLRGVEEMFMPVEDDGENPVERALSGGEKKVRREREGREAREKVQKQVAHWVGFFGGHEKYFEVGRVVGGPGVEGRGEERRELCEYAAKMRPKRSRINEQMAKGGGK
ncbi:hypothetical protein FQN53_004707 [Emmonsiellopsis sp. PD_33]|nr:hypothetical protein FQN53_004707 [Emmonsiellopsis sp. PD_33]